MKATSFVLWYQGQPGGVWLPLARGSEAACLRDQSNRCGYRGTFLVLGTDQRPEDFVEPARPCHEC